MASTPKNPEQEVTLSLHPPIKAKPQVYKKVIEIAPDLKRQIAMEMGCTVDTVYNALNLSNPTTGAQPDRIRRRAMELGGKENRKIRWINY